MNCSKNISTPFTLILRILVFLMLTLLLGCEKFEPERTVKVETGTISNISYTSCNAQGIILDISKTGIIDHGFCWATTQNPTTTNNKIQLDSKSTTGLFTGNLTDLSDGTLYYVRAYAQNTDGVFYGNQLFFKTLTINPPTISTNSISDISSTSAIVNVFISDDGGSEIHKRGTCWNTSQNPDYGDNHTDEGSGTGSFSSILTNLYPNTLYYVRGYANTNSYIGFGNELSFTTKPALTVTTNSVSDITVISAAVGGNVTSEVEETITEKGIYYGTSSDPETNGTKLQIGNGLGSFSTNLANLVGNTTYYIKAYATGISGTIYGNELSFTTLSDGQTSTVTDYDGNIYNTVIIGAQWWMAENLKVTHYPDGTPILDIYPVFSFAGGYRWYEIDFDADTDIDSQDSLYYVNNYGFLYSWQAIMYGYSSSNSNPSSVQGVCPDGWHLPSHDEWIELELYLGMDSTQAYTIISDFRGTDEGTKLQEGGITGFDALLGGFHWGVSASPPYFHSFGNAGWYWTCTMWANDQPYNRWFFTFNTGVGVETNSATAYKWNHMSIRCVKD